MQSAVPGKLLTLQAGRAVAALAVVLFHIRASVEEFITQLPTIVSAPFSYGYLGVDFFFVLSGFIIYHTNANYDPSGKWARHYASGRLLRIYTPYLPIGIGMGLIYSLLPELSASQREWGWFTTITLLPTPAEPALNVAWTLRHELVFYIFFCLAFLTGRPFAVITGWCSVIIATFLVAGSEWTENPILAVINLEFLFGMVAAKAVSWKRAGSASLFVLGLCCMLSFGLLAAPIQEGEARILFGLGISLLLVPLVRLEMIGRMSVSAKLVLLGEASYAIYLLHTPIISLLVRLVPGDWLTASIACFVTVVAAGLAYHLAFEKPVIGLLRAGLDRDQGKRMT